MTKKVKTVNIEFDTDTLSVEDITGWIKKNCISSEETDRFKKGLKEAVDTFINNGDKINAIKAYYAFTGLSFKECKDYVENEVLKRSVGTPINAKLISQPNYSYTYKKGDGTVFSVSDIKQAALDRPMMK